MYKKSQIAGLISGPAIFLLIYIFPRPESLSPEALAVGATAILMAIYWLTGAIPIPATALLPIPLFPILGVMKAGQATTEYANHLIFLFLGGFLIAIAMEKWNLHRRIALYTIKIIGGTQTRIILGFMVATAFLSMWISNTATTMMMVPIGLSVIHKSTEKNGDLDLKPGSFSKALMLAIAYSASIGGVATLIGTPPNTILAGFVETTYHQQIGFAQWMMFGVPLAIIMLAISWIYLTRYAFDIPNKSISGGKELINEDIKALGLMSKAEKLVLFVFSFVAISWILRGLINIEALSMISDSTIAITGAILLFVLPVDFKKGEFLLTWEAAQKLPWDVIILFGGGLTLAKGFKMSGLDKWVGSQLAAAGNLNFIIFIFIIGLVTMLLTELTSNTATAAMFIPIISGIAIAMGFHPYGPIIAAAIASSYAFMLPVATPPNAIIFGTKQVSIGEMAKKGAILNFISLILITILITAILGKIWEFDLYKLPSWLQ